MTCSFFHICCHLRLIAQYYVSQIFFGFCQGPVVCIQLTTVRGMHALFLVGCMHSHSVRPVFFFFLGFATVILDGGRLMYCVCFDFVFYVHVCV